MDYGGYDDYNNQAYYDYNPNDEYSNYMNDYSGEGTNPVRYDMLDTSYMPYSMNSQDYADPYHSTTPITVTWNVNAYAKKKTSVIKKLKKRFRPEPEKQLDIYNPIPEDSEYKSILSNVAGIAKPGQLMAIMGASGAGKTTLLNILNFRNKGSMIVDGEVKINGKPASWDKITRYSGYVQQDDLFFSTLTVREHLTIVAMLKMGRNYTKEQKYQRIEEVIYELNLIKSQNTVIGGEAIKGISGGEKRRLAFASEILTNPPLLFCDEPTSGLDAFMAQSLVDSMYSLAQQGKTVISTIHQPSSQIFEKFDTLCLLAEGALAYLGPAKDAPAFFASVGYQIPNLYNPADFYIQTLAILPNYREYSLQKAKAITDAFAQTPMQAQIYADIAEADFYGAMTEDDEYAPKYQTNLFVQSLWLLKRQFLMDLRNPLASKILLAQTIVIGVFLGLIFLRLKSDETGIQNRLGVLFILLMQCNFGYIFSVVNSLPPDLALVYREAKNRLYSLLPFYLAKQLAEFPKYVIIPFVLIVIVYWMTGVLDDFGVFIQISCTLIFCVQVSVSYALFISILAPNQDAAIGMVVPILMPLLIFAGFFLDNNSVPVYFIWLKYVSWLYYTNEIINVLLWRAVPSIPCTKTNTTVASTCIPSGCFKDGKQVLDTFNFSESNLTRDFLVMLAIVVALRSAAFLILRLKLRFK